VLHWSGHGHRNRLELRSPLGRKDTLSGEDLVALLQEAGGFYPRLVFLSACHSGALMQVKDWAKLVTALGLAEDRGTPKREDLPAPAADGPDHRYTWP